MVFQCAWRMQPGRRCLRTGLENCLGISLLEKTITCRAPWPDLRKEKVGEVRYHVNVACVHVHTCVHTEGHRFSKKTLHRVLGGDLWTRVTPKGCDSAD